MLQRQPTQSWSYRSPDGEWHAQVTVRLPVIDGEIVGEHAHTRFTVTRRDGQVEWVVLDHWSTYGMGFTVPGKLRWSADGQSLTFSNHATPDGCAVYCCDEGLLRLDLDDGTLTSLAPDVRNGVVSPDERTLAYLTGPQLVLRELETGTERSIAFQPIGENWQAGQITWSPAGQRIAFTVMADPCGSATATSIVLVDLASGSVHVPVAGDERLLVTFWWPTPDTLLLLDRDDLCWQLDSAGGEPTRVACPAS
jgi:hypothetical protein